MSNKHRNKKKHNMYLEGGKYNGKRNFKNVSDGTVYQKA